MQPYDSENHVFVFAWVLDMGAKARRLRMLRTTQHEDEQETRQKYRQDVRELNCIIDGFSYRKYTGQSTLLDTDSHVGHRGLENVN